MSLKSDRLKKLEAELRDLEQWLKLGLVPKNDLKKHQAEIENLRAKVADEKDRLQYLKESGDVEGYVTPRRQAQRPQYADMPTLPDLDVQEEAGTDTQNESMGDSLFDTQASEEATETEDRSEFPTEDDDPFSDRNRWRRGMLHGDDEEW